MTVTVSGQTARTIRPKRCFECRLGRLRQFTHGARRCSLGHDALGRVYEVDKAVDLLP
jgi:hypothetical protein